MRALRHAAASAAWLVVVAVVACSDEHFTEHEVAGRGGSLAYKLFVPAKPRPTPALIVFLHGCDQDADDAAEYTRLNAYADKRGFLVLYPQEVASRNPYLCWNWYTPAHQHRGRGEPSLIVRAVERVAREHHVDRERVFVAGLSAGAGMSAVLGACYPDVFSAIGLHSGPGYQGGLDVTKSLATLQQPTTDPNQQGERAHRCAGSAARVVSVIAIHGGRDREVTPANAEHTIVQFAQADDLADDGLDNDSIAASASEVLEVEPPGGLPYRVERTTVPGGPQFERVVIPALGHAWSGGGGPSSGQPDATRLMVDFFLSLPRRPARPARE